MRRANNDVNAAPGGVSDEGRAARASGSSDEITSEQTELFAPQPAGGIDPSGSTVGPVATSRLDDVLDATRAGGADVSAGSADEHVQESGSEEPRNQKVIGSSDNRTTEAAGGDGSGSAGTDTDTANAGADMAGAQVHANDEPLRVDVGAVFPATYGSLSLATDNFWSADVNEKEAAYSRTLAAVRTPAALDPLLVVRAGNGWAIVGDPAPFLAAGSIHKDDPDLATLVLPAIELQGTKAAIVFHVARAGMGGRIVRNMRRARLALLMVETDGLGHREVATVLGIHGSGATRDLQAARMEREHPALAKILTAPSDAPVSYYTDLREYAERQPAPEKWLRKIVAAAGRMAGAGRTFSPADAKAALGTVKVNPQPTGHPDAEPEARMVLAASGPARTAVLEKGKKELRLTLTFPASDSPFDQEAAQLEHWLAGMTPAVSHK